MMRMRIGVDRRFDGMPRRVDVIDRNVFRNTLRNTLRNIFRNIFGAVAVGFDDLRLRLRRFPRGLACGVGRGPDLRPLGW